MVDDDVLYGFRLRLFSLAGELGNVREACRILGVHPSTYYRWRGPVLRSGLEMLRPRERRPPRMPNQTSQLTEQRVIAFSPRSPGPRSEAHQRHPGPGALGRHRHQPQRRVAGAATPRPVAADEPSVAWSPAMPRHRVPSRPTPPPSATSRWTTRASSSASTASTWAGSSGTTGRVWQYTAIDLASSATSGRSWPRRRSTRAARITSQLARRVAADLRAARLAPRAGPHRQRLRVPSAGVRRHRPRSGRDPDVHPGRVVRPPTARSSGSSGRSSRSAGGRRSPGASCPSSPGSAATSPATCDFYNEERAHTGRLTGGRTPLRGARSERAR